MHPFETLYKTNVIPGLKERFGYANLYQTPKIVKVSINVGLGRALKDPAYLEVVADSLEKITGQKPIKTRAKKSIASFKIREGQVVGMKVTLRKKRMMDFVAKLLMFALPRVRDFRGLDSKAVDARGGLTIGFRENIAFPEVKSDEIEKVHGLEVTITTNAKSREEGLALFTLFGFPFKK
ncbi:50S ribosomal protein L5 [Candidatus Uhrbacteria bacterium]|nr:50S ribosomal protein L5 [Candidatus Uhrbacteria bacterium]